MHRHRGNSTIRLAATLVMALSAGVAAPIAVQAPPVVDYANSTTPVPLATNALQLDLAGAGPMEFHRVSGILPRRDGGFVVLDGGTRELRFFAAAGTHVRTVGRRGTGPGEYTALQGAADLPGDSIAVFDGAGRRVSILDANGAFVRSFTLQAPFEGGGSISRFGTLADGSILIGYSEVRRMAPQPEPLYFAQRLFRYTTTGELRAAVGIHLPDGEHFLQATPPTMGGVAYWDLAFGRTMTVRADATSLFVGDGTEWAIEQRSIDGSLLRTHRVRRNVVPVTTADRDAYRQDALKGSQGAQQAIAERMVSEMPYPRAKPAYRRFEPDGAGRLWIEVYPDAATQSNSWIRLDTRSRSSTAVDLPARFRPFAFTARAVYGIWRDQDDVEQVRRYALTP